MLKGDAGGVCLYVICDIPFSSLALTNVTIFISVKPQVPAPLECDWTITFQVFTSLPKYFLCPLDPVDKPKGYRKWCVYFTKRWAFSTDIDRVESDGVCALNPKWKKDTRGPRGCCRAPKRRASRIALRPRRRRGDKKGLENFQECGPIVLISTIGFMNIPTGRLVCGLFKQDINQW